MKIPWLCTFGLICASLARGAEVPGSALGVAQGLFEAMKAHDAKAASSLFLPDATLASVNGEGKSSVITAQKFVEHIGTGQGTWVERIWSPKVLEQGSIAVVWADYDFHLNGKFSHCGIDSFSLLKTEGKWKIASISDTREVSGCSRSPLGAPTGH